MKQPRFDRTPTAVFSAVLLSGISGCAALHPPTAEERLQALRGRIDGIDGQLLELAAERLAVAGEIGTIKKELGRPVIDPAREAAVVEAFVRRAGERGVPEATAAAIIQSLIAASRARQ